MSLTPATLLVLALAALVGIIAEWSDSLLAAVVWRACVALVAVGLTYELWSTRRFSVGARWLHAPVLRLGRIEPLDLEVVNRTRRDLAVELLPALPPALQGDSRVRTLELGAGAGTRARVDARPVALGSRSWPRLPMRIKGPLKLAWWSRALPVDGQVSVLPDTLGRSDARRGSAEIGGVARAVAGVGDELHALRDYLPLDPLRSIDWKATARASRLITRVFAEQQHLEVVLLVDAGRTSRTEIDGMPLLGHYANMAARFAERCAGGEDRVGLVAFADRPLASLAPARGMAAVARIRGALGELEPLGVESDVVAAALHVRRLVRRRCLVLLLSDLYQTSATSELAQSVRLLVPKHLPLIVGISSDEIVELARRRARDWLDPYRGLAAREYGSAIAANVDRLGRLGAYALTARPSEAEARVLDVYRLLRAQRRV